jgi:hypothetical protein
MFRSPRALIALCAAASLAPAVGRADDTAQAVPQADWICSEAVVSPAVLAKETGGAAQSSTVVLEGQVTGNQASSTVSGSNVIESGAFANTNGLPVVIQNSGNNVLIQSSTVVNVRTN